MPDKLYQGVNLTNMADREIFGRGFVKWKGTKGRVRELFNNMTIVGAELCGRRNDIADCDGVIFYALNENGKMVLVDFDSELNEISIAETVCGKSIDEIFQEQKKRVDSNA
jgi:hypothetical protein